VLGTKWIGPVDVPLDLVDTGDEDSWAASRPGSDTEHMERFEHRIQTGDEVHPAVFVQVPGSGKLKDVDGHHRYKAYANLGRPVKAYVGLADDDSPDAPWAKTHLYQQHSGGDPLNKQAGDEDPSRVCFPAAPGAERERQVAVPAAEARRRVVGPARRQGTRGGGAMAGRSPRGGGELGDLPDVQPAAVWIRPGDGHIVWTYLVDLPGMFTPSADGETSDETQAGAGSAARTCRT
jgi:hypothetical protein